MNFKENKSIYLQIADRICDEILLDKYKEDERIPSVREYASMVEVNSNTVMRTYDFLHTDDIIYNKRGIGYFISKGAKKTIKNYRKKTFMKDEIFHLFNQLYTLGISEEELISMYKEYISKQNNESL